MNIREQDLEIEFVRASGPGGQHRNRRETGVRLTHKPSGIVVLATERRSQSENRRVALERLVALLVRRQQRRKRRVASRPTRASRERRLESKKRRGSLKALRRGDGEG
jgi:protein subunit release factor B